VCTIIGICSSLSLSFSFSTHNGLFVSILECGQSVDYHY
jgi:hypothetical protein